MKKVLFLANHFVTLYNFRRELIERLVQEGYEVTLSLPESPDNRYFTDLGCRVVETPIARRSRDPFKDLRLLASYARLYREVRPDIAFSYTIKPNIYGSIAARLTGSRQICNITGTGEAFNCGWLLRHTAHFLYRASVRRAEKVFFQNTSDRAYFLSHRLALAERSALLPGSGVNLEAFPFVPMQEDGESRFIYVGRVVGLKGVDQYVQAARRIRAEYPNTRFYVAGFAEGERYQALMDRAGAEGVIEYLGFRKDIADWIRRCHCTVLPSHGGEGVPNVLLESAATGRVCVASRIPGCTDAVDEGRTGFLFAAGSVDDLTACLRRFLALSPEERAAMGRAGRELVAARFDRRQVIEAYHKEVEKYAGT